MGFLVPYSRTIDGLLLYLFIFVVYLIIIYIVMSSLFFLFLYKEKGEGWVLWYNQLDEPISFRVGWQRYCVCSSLCRADTRKRELIITIVRAD